MRKSKWILFIFVFSLFSILDLHAFPNYVPPIPEYRLKIVPLEDFNETYIIVQILNKESKNDRLLYTSGIQQRESRFQSITLSHSPVVGIKVIPYSSINDSEYFLKEANSIRQTQIKENCRNYFPTSKGKKNYLLFFRDDRREFGQEYFLQYEIWEDFEIPPNKSLYIEIDIVKREHKTSIIDTPADIFADMCK
ncbi:hypothetical protein EHQ16_12635 [Leptospira kanakyensis]|uniref:Uncharacterized protein n=1 Tax=Leptospira kanakyensis TaxID=2484968 RepID=A0A6N4PXN3_9LEPT|nr:hypothetical protein [Leptospira kanakyensis]TGK50044.1 hypothetical protein EHQ11_09985 [Leptospira kanakyensis]TGK58438.1 hypothetical protein EHQ16_12635 [Leptospira kanakyensis]TGK69182.1 hypothetical protein EHQ18_10145 [Leptospira kanakyensis]